MTDTTNPALPDYQYEGTYSDTDLVAATLARLTRLQPELTLLEDQLRMLGLTGSAVVVAGAAVTIEGLRALVLDRADTIEGAK